MKYIEKRAHELYTSSSGLSKPADQFGFGFPFLSYSDIFHNYFVPTELKTLVNSTEKDRETCSIKRGDVFLTRTSETTDELGMSCVALRTIENATFNGFAKRLRPITDEIVPEYAAYYFRSPYFRAQCMSMASLITRASLNDNMIGRLKIRYPEDRKDQMKIARILMEYDESIIANSKRINILGEMAENLYKEWFLRKRYPGNIKDRKPITQGKWEVQRLCEFGITLDSGSRPAGGIDYSLKEGIPSLGAEAVNELGEFDYSTVKLIPYEYFAKMKRGKNTGDDILIYKDGAYIGKTTIFMQGFPFETFAVNEHVFLLNAINHVYQYYLFFTLHLPEYYYLMQNLNRNAAQPGLSKQDIERIKIIIPDEDLVREFNKLLSPFLSELFLLAKNNYILQRQRDGLLPRLMSGKLTV